MSIYGPKRAWSRQDREKMLFGGFNPTDPGAYAGLMKVYGKDLVESPAMQEILQYALDKSPTGQEAVDLYEQNRYSGPMGNFVGIYDNPDTIKAFTQALNTRNTELGAGGQDPAKAETTNPDAKAKRQVGGFFGTGSPKDTRTKQMLQSGASANRARSTFLGS